MPRPHPLAAGLPQEDPHLTSTLRNGRPSTQKEAGGVDLIPEGRGRAPHWQDDSPPGCSELLAGDSPACAWPLFSRAWSAVQLMDAPVNTHPS